MKGLYASPLRVYLLLGLLALAGIYSGLKLPISLFPNSAKPQISVLIPYGNQTAESFQQSFGGDLEYRLQSISDDIAEVELLKAEYRGNNVRYRLTFQWAVSPSVALRETQNVVYAMSPRLAQESQDGIQIWANNENSGFFAASFYSPRKSLDELYAILAPILGPRISQISDSSDAMIWNPSNKEIVIELNPERMASLQLLPGDVSRAVQLATGSQSAGSLSVGIKNFSIRMPRQVGSAEELAAIPVANSAGKTVHLQDVARVDYTAQTTQSNSFKTSGAESLILYATPSPGGNVKRMSEDLIAIVHSELSKLPADVRAEIDYKILVDPSEFIRASIRNVMKEVLIGASLAVLILFIFIGSLRNTVTAAIEIPLSMVLAFILMRWSGMNLNLVSLGGLALSAGMNVDASVVVMENIFRHTELAERERRGKAMDFVTRLRVITAAVTEVRFALVVSTVSSLIVFLPLALTSGLSFAVLGDLAKTVVFSHGLSMIVALILVPTVRLHLMSREKPHTEESLNRVTLMSRIQGRIRALENAYAALLSRFVRSPRSLLLGGLAAMSLLMALLLGVLPRIPREVMGTPETDWMVLSITTEGNQVLKQMESQAEEIESRLLAQFGDQISYTFTQVYRVNGASIMARLKDKRTLRTVWPAMEKAFVNTPTHQFWVGPFNPAELPIPDPPQMRLVVRGGTVEDRIQVTRDLHDLFSEKKIFDRRWTEPSTTKEDMLTLKPDLDQWAARWQSGVTFGPSDLAELVRVATVGKRVAGLEVASQVPNGAPRWVDINLRYPPEYLGSVEALAALPVGVQAKIVPLRALTQIQSEPLPSTLYRENGHSVVALFGKQNESNKSGAAKELERAREVVKDFKPSANGVTFEFEDAEKDLHDALYQLSWAFGLSILLIFVTLVLQFGSVVSALLVLVAVPLGLIGVVLSLWIFRSTLSLNSVLGVILLNGIAVANSIILVDFMRRLVNDRGLSPEDAAVEAGRTRLRPILITSLTTVLGMLPIAIGMGDGGKILQPLGIAVSGGLWISMVLTLFFVPALQVRWLRRQSSWGVGPSREDGESGASQVPNGVPQVQPLTQDLFAPSGSEQEPSVVREKKPYTTLLWFVMTSAIGLNFCSRISVANLNPDGIAHATNVSLFKTLVETNLTADPQVRAQKTAWDTARASAVPGRWQWTPTLRAEGKRTWLTGLDPRAATVGRYDLGLSADLNLFRFGADYFRLRSGDDWIDAQAARLQSATLLAEARIVETLIERIAIRLEIEVLQETVAQGESLVKTAQARYERGLLPQQEVDQLGVDLENSRGHLLDAQVREAEVIGRIQRGGSIDFQGSQVLSWPWLSLLKESSVPATELRWENRPDVLAAQFELGSRVWSHRSGIADFLPRLDAQVTVFYGGSPVTGGGGASAWQGSLGISFPIWNQGRDSTEIRLQSIQREDAERRLAEIRREAIADSFVVREKYAAALQSLQSREKNLTVSRRLYQDALRRFRGGRQSANELAQDQSRLFDSELLWIRGISAAHLAYLHYRHAQGVRAFE